MPSIPCIGTTYRVTEHWQTGAMTRNLPWLVELVPNMFVEISVSLAKAKGIKNGDRVRVSTERGTIEAFALVTQRLKPFRVDGKIIEQVGMPWHFGYAGAGNGGQRQRPDISGRESGIEHPGIQGIPLQRRERREATS